jgi:predicted Zn-dependent protease
MMRGSRKILLALAAVTLTAPQPVLTQARAPTSISASDKAQGAKAHPELLREFGGAYAGPQSDYVRRVGQRIAVQSGLSNAQSDFTVTLLDSPVDNAFAIPGGYVYVTRNLLALMNDEAELASVMGHEVGHVAARHSQSRNQTSTIGSVLAGVVGAVAGNSTLGTLLGRGVGLGAQLYTLKFSRTQEYQADDLGVSYLAKAAYDPMASSSMLASLAAQNALDARAGGKTASSQPTMFSTHPDPASRVTRTANAAKATGYTRGTRNREAFLAAIDGMIYGDNPAQGIVDGQSFSHPGLKIAFTAPAGFTMANGTDAVTMTGTGGRAQFGGGRLSGTLESYSETVFRAVAPNGGLEMGNSRRFQVNGIDAVSTTARANTQSGPVDVTVVAYGFDPTTAYHFLIVTAAGSGVGPFASTVDSLRRLTTAEAAQIRPRRVRVVTVGARDTEASLAARMAYTSMQAERFRVLNGLATGATVRAGQKVKLIVWG